MIIQIALGIVLGFFFIALIIAAGYGAWIIATKHTELTDEYMEIKDWFQRENLADKLAKIRKRGNE